MNVLPSTCIKGYKDKVRDVRKGKKDCPVPTAMMIIRDSVVVADSGGKICSFEVTKGRTEEVFTCDSPINCVYVALGFIWTGHDDSYIRQWTMATGDMYRTMKGHRDKILSLCIMDKWLFSGSTDGFVYQWDLVSGDGVNFMPMTRAVLCVTPWVARNLLIAGDENGRMVYWDVNRPVGPPVQVKEVYSAQQKDKQGRTMIAPTHKLLIEKLKRSAGISVQEKHAGWLFAAAGNDRIEQRYVESGKLKRNLMHPGRVNDMTAAQGCLFTACDDKLARSWDVATGGLIQVFTGHRGALVCIAAHPAQETHVSQDLSMTVPQIRPGTMTSQKYLFTTSADGAITQWKVAARGACRSFAEFLEDTGASGIAAKEAFRLQMAEVGIEPVDPFAEQKKAEAEVQAKMDALLSNAGSSNVEEPDAPKPRRSKSPTGKKSPTGGKKKSIKSHEQLAAELEEKQSTLSKMGYASQMALMGFVNPVSQDFVTQPPQRHFLGRGVSIDDHAARYKHIESGWPAATEELQQELKVRMRQKMFSKTASLPEMPSAGSATMPMSRGAMGSRTGSRGVLPKI